MKNKKYIGALLAAAMLFQSTAAFADGNAVSAQNAAFMTERMEVSAGGQMTPGTIRKLNNNKAVVHKTEDGQVYFIEGSCSEGPVTDMNDAARVVESMKEILGGDDRVQFVPWRTLSDTADNQYYVFQQMYADTTVSGGAVKVVTDKDGNMTGLVSSVVSELPEEEAGEGITAAQAEQIAVEHEKESVKETGKSAAELIEGRTEKIVLPVNLELDPESDEVEESRFVWVVYTGNPDAGSQTGSGLPYLAHYVAMDGEYLYSMPTVAPGDEAGTTGFNASYAFEFMEPAEYTGMVELSDGTQKEITVTLMRDTRTGMYYLGNIERRIVVADCYEFLYNNGNVEMEASADNTGWDNTCLLSLYNYCRAWDYYNEIGWKGGDGLGTPTLILKDFCDSDHVPINNAAYAGNYYGWQLFLSSAANDYSQCLDVLAHEYTHCVTESVMTYNSYVNDYGAINEAMSDIQGNICEMMNGATQDDEWNLGENSSEEAIRSMSDPHAYNQPEYSWDVYYVPKVRDATALNDQGGVHMNSSLLNNVAYRLCKEGKMTLEEARSFWFAADCAMVPGTDYAQLSTLLPWVLKNQGMDQYASTLEKAIEATRLSSDEIPDTLEKNQTMVTLKLPDTDWFNDGNWALNILSINPEDVMQRAAELLDGKGSYATALDELLEILFEENVQPEAADTALGTESAYSEEAGDETQDTGMILYGKAQAWIRKYLGGLVYFGNGSAGEDGTTVRMVCRPGYTIPILTRMEIDEDSMMPKSLGLAAYMFGRWIDLGAVIEQVSILCSDSFPEDFDPEEMLDQIAEEFSYENLMEVLSALEKPVFFELKEGETCEIPAQGLEDVTVLDGSLLFDMLQEVSEMTDASSEEMADVLSEEMTDAPSEEMTDAPSEEMADAVRDI